VGLEVLRIGLKVRSEETWSVSRSEKVRVLVERFTLVARAFSRC